MGLVVSLQAISKYRFCRPERLPAGQEVEGLFDKMSQFNFVSMMLSAMLGFLRWLVGYLSKTNNERIDHSRNPEQKR